MAVPAGSGATRVLAWARPFGVDDPDFITSTVEDDSVGSSMTDYADRSQTLRVRAVAKTASDLSVPLEIDDFVDHGLVTIRSAQGCPQPQQAHQL
jgi:hypothetical protein